MEVYGKTAANAIAVISYLVARPGEQAGSSEIAEARNIPQTLTAKLLTRLASVGLVVGQAGRGGGYKLAKAPESISLMEIVSMFEQTEAITICPFGHGWCGIGEPCPLHDLLRGLEDEKLRILTETYLSVFAPT